MELALIELGYQDVFPHVGRNTRINVGGKLVWPLVTGTFGGTDFIHSLLGEATDKLSQTSLTDLNAAVSSAQMKNTADVFAKLKSLMSIIPSGETKDSLEQLQLCSQHLAEKGKQFHLQGTSGDGPAISAQEIAKQIYPILILRDKIMKGITNAIEFVSIFCTTTNQDSWSQ